MQVAFEGEIILTQHCIKNKRIDAYFSKYKIGIEVDEYNHEGRNFEYEQSRKFMTESHGITIIRTNPDDADFDMNKLKNQIYTQIIKSTKEQTKVSTKNPLIESLNKIKVFKIDCQKYFTKLQKIKKQQPEIKPIKIGKQPRTT